VTNKSEGIKLEKMRLKRDGKGGYRKLEMKGEK
jgi:hypothetical protein